MKNETHRSLAPAACRRPSDATREAVRASLDWVEACQRLGWPADDLDALESLWWQYHDSHGNKKTPNAQDQPRGNNLHMSPPNCLVRNANGQGTHLEYRHPLSLDGGA